MRLLCGITIVALVELFPVGLARGQSWARSYDDPGIGFGLGADSTPDRGMVVCGSTTTLVTDATLARLDRDGDVLWGRNYIWSNFDALKDVVSTDDGGFVACGGTDCCSWILKVDGDDGLPLIEVTTALGEFRDIARCPDGGYMASGFSGSELLVTKVDASLQGEWQKRYALGQSARGVALVVHPEGGIVVAARVLSTTGDTDLAVLRLDATGTLMWTRTLGSDADDALEGAGLEIAGDGGVYVGAGVDDFWILRLDEDGETLWETTLDLGGVEVLEDLTSTSRGGLVAVGRSDGGGWALELDSVGAVVWEREFMGHGFTAVSRNTTGGYAVAGSTARNTPNLNAWALRLDRRGRVAEDCPTISESSADQSFPTSSNTVVDPSVSDEPFLELETSVFAASANLSFFVECEGCTITYEPFGVGLEGSGGFVPVLEGVDGPCAGEGRAIRISDGLGGASGVLWMGLGASENPFAGGTLYIDFVAPWFLVPITLSGPPGIPGGGFLELPGSSDRRDLVGLQLTLQATLLDSGAAFGLSLTNALTATVGD